MTEPKKTSITFTFEDHPDGRYAFDITGDSLDTAQTYVLWTKCMEVLLLAPDLLPDKRAFIQNVYNHIMSPAEKVISRQEKMPLRVVTVYKTKDPETFAAVEYHALAGTAEKTGWIFTGAYSKVLRAMEKAFGVLVKIPRDETDDPSVVESWI